jgi:thiol-disulfide isomerase/thioredoxin
VNARQTPLLALCALLVPAAAAPAMPRADAGAAKAASARPKLERADVKKVLAEVRRPGAKAVLLNVWASWCDPCREEMPDLVRFLRANEARGLRLVLVSADAPDETEEAEKFLASQGIDFRSFVKTGGDMTFIDGLDKRWSGALPVTFLYDGRGRQRHLWQTPVTFEMLQAKLDELLGTAATKQDAKK